MTLHVPFRRLAPVILALCSGSVFAATVTEFDGRGWKDFKSTINGSVDSEADKAFDKVDNAETNGVHFANSGCFLVADFTGYSPDPSKPKVYVSEIEVVVAHNGNSAFSLWTSEDGVNWNSVTNAQNVHQTGKSVFKPKTKALQVKYVVDSSTEGDLLQELRIKGWWTSEPTKISSLARSIFFRNGSGTRGYAGTNGGHYSDRFFNGNFTDYTYCNLYGTTELVIPTTGLDDQGKDTGVAWYVTDFKVGHNGKAQYSLYYTTEPEPANITSYAADPRTWTLITGASHVQEAGTKNYLVKKDATAVKYVFDTGPDWTVALAEVEVWAMDPDDLPCTHPNLDLATAAWIVCKPATCTENAFEECFCPDCGERFEQEVSLSKLGHDFVATLTKPGRHDSWGSGYVTCARTIQNTNTLEVVWSCDYRIDFTTNDVDLTTLGGPPINGVVQYTDLTVSSIGAQDGGIKPEYLMDNAWSAGWGGAFYFAECSSNEYAQYAFGTKIELTKIEFSVINEYQMVYLSKYDPATGEETLLKVIPIEKITNFEDHEDPETGEITQVEVTPSYQRLSVDFFVSDISKKIVVDAIRMRIGDYVDPESGAVLHAYRGFNYGANHRHTIICEFHPWGTIQGAGPLTHSPTTVMIFR